METSISMADFYEEYLNENLNLIDVREEHEFQAGHAPGAKNLPLSTLEQGYKELKPDQEYHVICQGGVRYECLARSSKISKKPIKELNRFFHFCNPLI